MVPCILDGSVTARKFAATSVHSGNLGPGVVTEEKWKDDTLPPSLGFHPAATYLFPVTVLDLIAGTGVVTAPVLLHSELETVETSPVGFLESGALALSSPGLYKATVWMHLIVLMNGFNQVEAGWFLHPYETVATGKPHVTIRSSGALAYFPYFREMYFTATPDALTVSPSLWAESPAAGNGQLGVTARHGYMLIELLG